MNNKLLPYCFSQMLLGGSFPEPDSNTSPQLLRLMIVSTAVLVFCIFSVQSHIFHHPLLPRHNIRLIDLDCHTCISPSASLFLCHVYSGDSAQGSLSHATSAKSTALAFCSSLSCLFAKCVMQPLFYHQQLVLRNGVCLLFYVCAMCRPWEI